MSQKRSVLQRDNVDSLHALVSSEVIGDAAGAQYERALGICRGFDAGEVIDRRQGVPEV